MMMMIRIVSDSGTDGVGDDDDTDAIIYVFQSGGTSLATGSYDGFARIWSTDGEYFYLNSKNTPK